MYKINEDLSIYVTRGDAVLLNVQATDKEGKPYTFIPGDNVRIKVYKKKKVTEVLLNKTFTIETAMQNVQIYLSGNETKFDEPINKPTTYWYEVVLNEDTDPQTIIGYDPDEGARLFILLPEGVANEDVEDYEPSDDDRYMDYASLVREMEQLKYSQEKTHEAVAKVHVTPEMFGAIGDGVSDDTDALQKMFATEKNISMRNCTYLVSDTIDVESDTVITLNNAKILSNATENKKYIFNIDGKENIKIYGDNASLEMAKPETAQQACIAIFNSKNILVDGLNLAKAGGDGVIIGGSVENEAQDVIINHCIIDNSRRNGISVIGGVNNIKIHDCIIKNTNGTIPQLGIDIETWQPELINRNIEVSNCRFENNTNGSLTVFEYTDGVKIHDNYFDGSVNIKKNDDYVSVSEATPTNIEMYNNTFKATVYIYRVSDGVFAIKGNVFDGSHITIDHSVSMSTDEAIKKSPAKIICNNVFNDCGTAIYIGNNANISVLDNIINNCTMFLHLFGLRDCVVSGNIVNGYNADGDLKYGAYIFGVVKNLDIHDNIIKQPSGTNSVTNLFYVAGGSVERLKVHHNNFEKASFTKVIFYDAIGSNIDYANATNTSKNHTESLCSPCEYLVGTIVTVKVDGVLTPKICVKDGSTYGWRNITFESVP